MAGIRNRLQRATWIAFSGQHCIFNIENAFSLQRTIFFTTRKTHKFCSFYIKSQKVRDINFIWEKIITEITIHQPILTPR